jgi:hypothetical protein
MDLHNAVNLEGNAGGCLVYLVSLLQVSRDCGLLGCCSWSLDGHAEEWRAGMQCLPLQGGGSKPEECVEGIQQAPQQDITQVPCTQLPTCVWGLRLGRPPGNSLLNQL